jgi:hypothetical protein
MQLAVDSNFCLSHNVSYDHRVYDPGQCASREGPGAVSAILHLNANWVQIAACWALPCITYELNVALFVCLRACDGLHHP